MPDSKDYIPWLYYILLPLKYLRSCDSHKFERAIDGNRNRLWRKHLSFHIQIAKQQQVQDWQAQGKKKIAYSLREEKVTTPGYGAITKMQHTMKRDIYYEKIKDIIKRCN